MTRAGAASAELALERLRRAARVRQVTIHLPPGVGCATPGLRIVKTAKRSALKCRRPCSPVSTTWSS